MRVLIIEDEHKIAQAIKEGLEAEAFAVDLAFESEEGLHAARNETYDLIVLDRMLPGLIDGMDICQTLRAEGNHTPVLMLAAKDQARHRIEGLHVGADDYLIKPFSFEELLARIKALLRSPREDPAKILEVGDLTLDTTAKVVERAGQSIMLSAKEYALLEYLMRNKGKVLSKHTIMNHVWDFEADILPNTVEVFITYLRAKVDRPFEAPGLIRTVRGFGYKIEQ